MSVPGSRRRSFGLSVTTGLLAFHWLLTLPALALDPKKAITQYVHDVWQTEQGLPQNSVLQICQTRDGYLWLGTEEGLVRFDGVRFTVFDTANTPGLRSNSMSALLEDRSGRLWIGTEGGLSLLEDGVIRFFSKEGLPSSDRVGAILEDREGTLWIGTMGSGLKRLAKGALRTYTVRDGLSDDRITALREDREGTLWIGTAARGLDRFKDGRFTHLGKRDGLSSDRIQRLYEDREGTIWVGTYGGGLNRIRDGKVTRLSVEEGLSSDRILAISQDREGTLWIGTAQGSVDRLEGTRISSFKTRDGLTGLTVNSLLEDREGSLWIGTNGGGLNRLRDGKVTPFSTKEGLASDVVFPIFEDRDGNVWIGTRASGVNRLGKDGRVSLFTKKDGLPGDEITSIGDDAEGNVWVGTRGGIGRFTNGKFSAFTASDGFDFGESYVNQIYRTRQGALLISVGSKLIHFVGGRFTPFLEKDWPLPAGGTAEDREGNLWIGTYGRGLFRVADGSSTRFSVEHGLSSDSISAVHEDREGHLWIGTLGAGLNRLSGGRLTPITTKAGLPSDAIASILEDDQGNLWMSSYKGIFRASKKELNAFAEGKARGVTCTVYGTVDGMRSVDCSAGLLPSGWRARDGRLWFTTLEGAVVIDPERLPTNPLPPPVVVEEVLVDKRRVDRSGSASSIVVPPGAEKLELRYTALSLRIPQRVVFKYRLEGFDKDWVDAGTQRTAHYTNLPPRRYVFRVIASNDDGVWNETGASFAFSLKPHFYQTWWFSFLSVVAVAAMGAEVQRARVRRLKMRERELVQVVEERTNDLQAANADLRRTNEALHEAQEKISRLLESSPGASESVPDWSRSVAAEIAATIGAKAIGIWEVDRDVLTPVSDSGLTPPSRVELDGLVSAVGQSFVESGGGMIVPVTGMSGELCGTLLVSGNDVAWGETERHLVAGFAHQLGGALEMKKIRRQLAAAEEHRAATRREMQERGIATLQICPSCGRCYDHTAAACLEDGARLDSPRPLPYLLLGRYRFTQVLGQGGMGLVLSAHDEKLGRDVAVKLIRPEHFNNAELKQRFEREARTVARIQHPGVVALYDSGELDDGTAFLAMEQLSGCDMALLLKTHGRGTPAQVARLVRQGCAALRASHRAGVIHRDVKPENVFLVDDPSGFRVKLLDFGLAKSMTFEKGLTETGMLIGTPAYMAPEQVQGDDVDARADVYSFAAVAYEALTGMQAISGSDLGRVLVHVLNTTPPPVSSIVTGIPPDVDAAFESALAKDPARRLKDIELWSSSFVDVLDKVQEDGTSAGWPISSGFFTKLRDSQTGGGKTLRLPGRKA